MRYEDYSNLMRMVPNYGNQSNIKEPQSRNLTEAWKTAKDHAIDMYFEQSYKLFETLDHCLKCKFRRCHAQNRWFLRK